MSQFVQAPPVDKEAFPDAPPRVRGKYFRALRSSALANTWILTLWGLDYHQLVKVAGACMPGFEILSLKPKKYRSRSHQAFKHYLRAIQIQQEDFPSQFITDTLQTISGLLGLQADIMDTVNEKGKSKAGKVKMVTWTLEENTLANCYSIATHNESRCSMILCHDNST